MRSRGHEFGLKKVKSALCDTSYALCSCSSFSSFFLFPLCLTSVLLLSFAHIFIFIRPTHMRSRGHVFGLKKSKVHFVTQLMRCALVLLFYPFSYSRFV